MTISSHSRAKRRCEDSEFTPNGQKVDNSDSTLQKLFKLYRQAELCDVQLQVGPCLFQAHKLILSMSSDVFKTMLTDAKWPDAHKACIVLSEESECVQVFGEFLQYMYTGSIHLTNISVLPLLTLADKYNIYDLGRECKHYMASHCHAALPSLKVVSWLQYAVLCNDKYLEAEVRHYMELNFNHVMQSDDFLTIRQDTLEHLLNCQHLIVHSEFALFTCLKKWFLHNTGASLMCDQDLIHSLVQSRVTRVGHRRKAVKMVAKKPTLHIMSYVRLPLMKHAQLLALHSDPFVQVHTDFFSCRLQEALNVHVSPLYKKRRSVQGTVDDTVLTSGGSKYLRRQKLTVSTNCGHSFPGSRTLIRRNSDPSLVFSSKTDVSELAASCTVHTPLCTTTYHENHATVSNSKQNELPFVGSSFNGLSCEIPVMSPVNYHAPSHCWRGSPYYSHTPRNYTCDDWSTCLTIEEFAAFPCYGSQAYFFSTPASSVPSSAPFSDRRDGHEEMDDHTLLEWQAELYPRGVRFPGAKMISIPDSYDIDESCRDVVRLAINSKSHHHQPCRVQVVVLAIASGLADGTEYIEKLTQKSYIFDEDHTVLNIDDIVPFWELNHVRSKYLTDSVICPGKKSSCFKLVVIIKPVHE